MIDKEILDSFWYWISQNIARRNLFLFTMGDGWEGRIKRNLVYLQCVVVARTSWVLVFKFASSSYFLLNTDDWCVRRFNSLEEAISWQEEAYTYA